MKKSVRLKEALGYEILNYLMRHPRAMDSIEGIVEWWLLEQRIVNVTARTKAALGELTASTLLIARHALDGRTHYRLNARRKKEIQAMLDERSKRRRTSDLKDL